jgi:hypothetical protein
VSVPVEQVTERSKYLCSKCSPPDTVNGNIHFQDVAFDSTLNRHSAEKELLKSFPEEDLSDLRGFLSGFQIKKIRTEERELPDWARTTKGIQKILLTAFPKLAVNENQRKRAGRWAQVIQLYFRMGWTFDEVAKEMNEKSRTVEMLIRSIVRTSRGERPDGSGPRVRNMP